MIPAALFLPSHSSINHNPLPAYLAVLQEFADNSLDFILVDGHYRTTCIRSSLGKLKPGGLLLVDDENLWQPRSSLPIPAPWELVDESTNGINQSCIWRKPL